MTRISNLALLLCASGLIAACEPSPPAMPNPIDWRETVQVDLDGALPDGVFEEANEAASGCESGDTGACLRLAAMFEQGAEPPSQLVGLAVLGDSVEESHDDESHGDAHTGEAHGDEHAEDDHGGGHGAAPVALGVPQNVALATQIYEQACELDYGSACLQLLVLGSEPGSVGPELQAIGPNIKRSCDNGYNTGCVMWAAGTMNDAFGGEHGVGEVLGVLDGACIDGSAEGCFMSIAVKQQLQQQQMRQRAAIMQRMMAPPAAAE